MAGVDVVIFHHAPRDDDPPLVRLLAEAHSRLLKHQLDLWGAAGATRVLVVPGREDASPGSTAAGESFGGRLAQLIDEQRIRRLVVMGSGAVPLLRRRDAERLVRVAGGPARQAATNNRYSSDICAISDATVLRTVPALPSDNALPRWLEEHAAFSVTDLPGRDRLALDLDTPLDLALVALSSRAPAALVALALEHGLEIPRLAELRGLAADPRREMLVFGRSGSRTLRWLERNVRCRVRFLAEERGLRASSPLAIATGEAPPMQGRRAGRSRRPRATLGRLIAERGARSLASIVGDLADGAIIDSRVLLADRLGADESRWPSAADRFGSDLLRPDEVRDRWLADLTRSAAGASSPILMGAHTLVGPGIPLLLRRLHRPSQQGGHAALR
jgi:hypothetical protein